MTAIELAKQISTCETTKKWRSLAILVGFIFGVTVGAALVSRSEDIRGLSAAQHKLFTETLSTAFQSKSLIMKIFQ